MRDWREPWDERFDLALAADVLYERRNVEPVLARLRELAPDGARRARRATVRGGVPSARASRQASAVEQRRQARLGCVKNGEWPESSSITRAPCSRAVAICQAGVDRRVAQRRDHDVARAERRGLVGDARLRAKLRERPVGALAGAVRDT